MSSNVEKILIIGLRMICSSIPLSSKLTGIEVFGFDNFADTTSIALDKKIIDQSIEHFDKIVDENFINNIDLVILAVPPKQTLDVLIQLKDIWNSEITITDTSSCLLYTSPSPRD